MIKDVCFNDPRLTFHGVGVSKPEYHFFKATSREYKTVEAAKKEPLPMPTKNQPTLSVFLRP